MISPVSCGHAILVILRVNFKRTASVVLFGSASSPFMLYATLHHHLTQCSSTVSKDLLQNLYVDNILSRCSTKEESVVFYIYQSQNNFR